MIKSASNISKARAGIKTLHVREFTLNLKTSIYKLSWYLYHLNFNL